MFCVILMYLVHAQLSIPFFLPLDYTFPLTFHNLLVPDFFFINPASFQSTFLPVAFYVWLCPPVLCPVCILVMPLSRPASRHPNWLVNSSLTFSICSSATFSFRSFSVPLPHWAWLALQIHNISPVFSPNISWALFQWFLFPACRSSPGVPCSPVWVIPSTPKRHYKHLTYCKHCCLRCNTFMYSFGTESVCSPDGPLCPFHDIFVRYSVVFCHHAKLVCLLT